MRKLLCLLLLSFNVSAQTPEHTVNVLSAAPLSPFYSLSDPISFVGPCNRLYHIGIWEFIHGKQFSLVVEYGPNAIRLVQYSRQYPVQEDDANGYIEDSGGIDSLLEDVSDNWSSALDRVTCDNYSGFSSYINSQFYWDGNRVNF